MSGIDLPPRNEADDVLAQPTRRRLLALLSELGGSAGTEALAARLGMHPNGVRTHLQRMRDAGLVVHRRASGARGRPRDEWAISPGARPGGEAPHGYAALARWLALAIPASPARLREVEQVGRRIGGELAGVGAGGRGGAEADAEPDAADVALADALAALGFEPSVTAGPGGQLSCRLWNCPYRDAVRENRDVVCTLHRGLTQGLLDTIAPGATLKRFVPHDPEKAGCEVEIDGVAR